MAAALGVPPSTVMSWQRNRKIPAWRHASILEVAKAKGAQVVQDDLDHIGEDDPTEQTAA